MISEKSVEFVRKHGFFCIACEGPVNVDLVCKSCGNTESIDSDILAITDDDLVTTVCRDLLNGGDIEAEEVGCESCGHEHFEKNPDKVCFSCCRKGVERRTGTDVFTGENLSTEA